jgi:hypothetical protein
VSNPVTETLCLFVTCHVRGHSKTQTSWKPVRGSTVVASFYSAHCSLLFADIQVSWPEGAPSKFDNEWTVLGINAPMPEIRAGRQLSWRFKIGVKGESSKRKSFTSINFIKAVQKALEYAGKPKPGWLINMEIKVVS